MIQQTSQNALLLCADDTLELTDVDLALVQGARGNNHDGRWSSHTANDQRYHQNDWNSSDNGRYHQNDWRYHQQQRDFHHDHGDWDRR